MVTITIIIACMSILVLYNNTQKDIYNRLTDIVQREKSFASSLFEDNNSEPHVTEHLRHNITLGQYGEIVYGKMCNDSIAFIITSEESEQNLKIPKEGNNAEPMQRALNGENGFIKSADYNGVMVYAAYTFFEKQRWGIVAKIPVSEINSPYIRALAIVFVLAFIFISISLYFFVKILNPIIDSLKKNKEELVDQNMKLNSAFEELLILKNKAEQSEAKFKGLFDRVGDAIFMYDPMNYEITEANEATSHIYGYDRDELIGMSCLLFSAEIEKSIKARDEINSKGKATVKNRHHKKKDGTDVFVELSGYKIDVISETITFAVCHDITIIKRKNDELRKALNRADENEFFLTRTQEIGNIGSFKTDFISGLWKASPALDKIFGIDDTYDRTLIGWSEMIHIEDRNMMDTYLNEEVVDNKTSFAKEYRITRINDKQTRWVQGFGETTFDHNGNLIELIGTIQDITERKTYENILLVAKNKAQESDQLKTEFINNMSHEIRTPMNGILGFSEMLSDPTKSEEKKKHFIKIIQNSGNQLMRIIDDILEISKLGTKQVLAIEKQICLNDLCLELFSIFDIKAKENSTPLYLTKGLSDDQSTILTDKSKLNKILSNLLENALKFTNTGFIEFGYILNNDTNPTQLEIYVNDTGIGINKNKQETIFERFSQEEKELSKSVGGLGLGLSIAKENAELLGGKITLNSEKGKGSSFIVTIPYKPVHPNTEDENLRSKDNVIVEPYQYTVLIVEDEEINYLYLETVLEDEIGLNCNILHAKQGKEAVEICKCNSDIDIVLMDLKMPLMNGFEASKLISELRSDLPIIAQTAYTTHEDKERALLAGCDDFISKPICKDILCGIINKYLIKDKSFQ